MSLPLAILLGVLPSLCWLWLFVRRDAHEPEPWSLVALAFALGGIAAPVGLWLRAVVEVAFGPFGPVADAFAVTALGEETLKLLALFPLLLHRELDEPMDGVVYGAAVGLGFAAVENVCYGLLVGEPGLLLQRAFTATLVHACCTGCLGFCCAVGKTRGAGAALRWQAAGLGAAIVLHGSYDLFLSGGRRRALLALLVVLPIGLVLLALKIRWALLRSRQLHPPQAATADDRAPGPTGRVT